MMYTEIRYIGNSKRSKPFELIIDHATKQVYFPELEFTNPDGKVFCESYALKNTENDGSGYDYVFIPNFKMYRKLKPTTGKKKMWTNMMEILSWNRYPADALNAIVDEYADAYSMGWFESVMEFDPIYFTDREFGSAYRERTMSNWDVPIMWTWTIAASFMHHLRFFGDDAKGNIHTFNERQVIYNEHKLLRFKDYNEAKKCIDYVRDKLPSEGDSWDLEVRQYVYLNGKEGN